MPRYAHIIDGTVTSWSEPSPTSECSVEIPDNVECGWVIQGGVWSDPLSEDKRKAAIKAKASAIILARIPLWKQINMTARYAELQGKYFILPLSQDRVEMDALEAIYAWVKAVRKHSDDLEADPNLAENWPNYE